jgi:hypothetical protein
MTRKFELGSDEYLKEAQQILDKLISILFKANEKLPNSSDNLRMAMSVMAWPIIESGHSMLVLSSMDKQRDCYILARPIFEHVLNIGYFGAKGEDAIKKSIDHYYQKTYRDLYREINIKDIKVAIGLNNIEAVHKDDNLRKAIEDFTTKKGFEERSWTGDNTFKKIEIISDKYGKNIGTILTLNLFFIYRHSSEIIHGTMFGVLHTRGLTQLTSQWPENDEKLKKLSNTNISFLLMNVMLLTYCALEIINHHFPIEDDIVKARDLVKEYREEIAK